MNGSAETDDEPKGGYCAACGGEGRIYSGHPNDPHPPFVGMCKACDGTGMEPEPPQPDDTPIYTVTDGELKF